MWLDAFKPKPKDMQKSGVSGVSGVNHGAKPIAIRLDAQAERLTPGKVAGVSGARQPEKIQDADTTDTDGHHTKNRCQSVKNGFKPNSHAGFEGALTPLTPLTPQKHNKPENSGASGPPPPWQLELALEFIEVDGLTPSDAQALAAVSVRPRPPTEWLALIAELDDLIERYCLVARLTGDQRDAVLSERRLQSLASIPATAAYFRREVGRMDRERIQAAPAPRQAPEMNYVGRARDRTERAARTTQPPAR